MRIPKCFFIESGLKFSLVAEKESNFLGFISRKQSVLSSIGPVPNLFEHLLPSVPLRKVRFRKNIDRKHGRLSIVKR